MSIKKICIIMGKTVIVTAVITVLFLILLTFALYKWNFREEYLNAGINFTYLVSNFFGGIIIGKVTENKRFIWGILSGIAYFAVLVILSIVVKHSVSMDVGQFMSALCVCTLGGMLGGMVS